MSVDGQFVFCCNFYIVLFLPVVRPIHHHLFVSGCDTKLSDSCSLYVAIYRQNALDSVFFSTDMMTDVLFVLFLLLCESS